MQGSTNFEIRESSQLSMLGRDYRGVHFELLCEPGDRVRAGVAVMRDARRPDILFTAPSAGRISRIVRGARRKLVALQIEVDASGEVTEFAAPAGQDQAAQRAFMLASGSWSSLRTRPFGNIPDPATEPTAVLITAIDSQPMAPPVAPVIDAFAAEFSAAVTMLGRISSAPLFICHAPEYRPVFSEASGARCNAFTGGHTAGLPGRHIQALCPIGFAGAEVWHIGYQETIALGHLLLHGRPWAQRIVALAGDAVLRPRCLAVTPGAALAELLEGELEDGSLQILAGGDRYRQPLATEPAFLGVSQRLLKVIRATAEPAADDIGALDMKALIPGDWLEANGPPGIYAVPLMRALQLGDVERARELGALELVEEDVDALSRVCVSNSNYGLLLRQVLDQLESTY
jgi:Na+-transporting NADH:ubiquinone oxidoreductase subunit A